ncbi:MAG: T9SS type A sorting domain-containing protein [Bacteroidales bacterium]|nr:T9SS type A sorting domain-containing protein [Bacteroidales bacterium]
MKATRLHTLLALLLMAGGVTMQAQEYESYFGADSTRLNVFEQCIDWGSTGYLRINTADSVHINGHDYLHAIPQGFSDDFELYLREETASGRLYRYCPLFDEEEVLLCDMTLTVGDTFEYTDEWETRQVVVESVSFENGRKVIRFALPVYPWHDHDALTFREGIFPNNYPIGFMDYYYCENNLLCEYKDGEQVFENPEYNTCYIDETSVQEQDQQQVSLCPNPAKENVLIKGIELAEVQVYNALGQLVKTVQNAYEINVSDLLEGIYLLRITAADGECYTKRVAVRR